MSRERSRFYFSEDYDGDIHENYPEVSKCLRIIFESLISSKIFLPKMMDAGIPLEYQTIDELMDLVEASGYLKNAADVNFWGDTVLYTSDGEVVYNNIISFEGFRPFEPFFSIVIKTDHWLPMMMDEETMDFTWNLELHKLNYHRIPAFLKKLKEDLGWKNEGFSFEDNYFASLKVGDDFFTEKSIIIREYEANPNPDFDLDAYLAAMQNAREQAPNNI
jgi:hypothetical protein